MIYYSQPSQPPHARCRSSMANGHSSNFLASKNLPPPWPLSCNSSAPFLLSNTLVSTFPHLPHSSLLGVSIWSLWQPPPSAPSSTTGERARPRSCWTAAPPSSHSSPPSPSLLTTHLPAGRTTSSSLQQPHSSLPLFCQLFSSGLNIIPCSRFQLL